MSKILIVEDNRNNMRLFRQILVEMNPDLFIAEATSGREAIEYMADTIFDIVLMDISLPDIDGIQTRKELKKMPAYEKTVFIAVTAHVSKIDEEKLLVDFDYYLPKPVDEDKMVELINSLLVK